MSIDPLKNDKAAVLVPGQPAKSVAPVAQDAGKGSQAASDQVLLTKNHDAAYQELQVKQQRSNAAASAIRAADRALETVGQKIDAMKASLDAIVKNFPPFSLEDKARMDLMRSYSSIRKEIDQLTLPPPPDVVEERKALELPARLQGDASDSQIADHVADLDAVAASVSDARAGLAADTAEFLQSGRFTALFALPEGAKMADSGGGLAESQAARLGEEVGRQFAMEVGQGVTTVSSQFLKGL